jgi:hypothetical protein
MAEPKSRPRTLTLLALAGACFAASAWFLSYTPIPRLHASGCGFWAEVWSNRLRFLIVLGLPAIGLVFSLRAENKLRVSLMDDQWTAAELDSARALISLRFWRPAGWVLLSAMVAALFYQLLHFPPRHADSHLLFIYVLCLPGLTAVRIRQMLIPSPTSQNGLQDWQNFKPIQSEHWGQAECSPNIQSHP